MMAQPDRLRALQVSVPGHDHVDVFAAFLYEAIHQLCKTTGDAKRLVQQVQAQVESYLIVAAPGSMKLARRLPYFGLERFFNVDVDILQIVTEFQTVSFDGHSNLGQPLLDGLRVLGRYYPLLSQHLNVSHAASHIVQSEAFIKGNRSVKSSEQRIHPALEAAFPYSGRFTGVP